MLLMLMVVLCYTICSLSDKYAVAKIKFNGNELTFLMAAATAVFMTFTLPFVDTHVVWGLPAVAAILLLTASKMLEFQMSALILRDMSAFELKAWLGICLFASYFTDIAMKTQVFSWVRLAFIAVTVVGLILIAQAGRKTIHYGKILLPLIVYLAAKYGYGFVIAAAEPYISSTMCLYFALILLALILLPVVHPVRIFKEKRNGGLFVVLTKIPNVAGLLGENAVIAVSLANYSFIQPMILVVLFFWGIARKEEEHDLLSVLGGIVCIVGIVGFQLL